MSGPRLRRRWSTPPNLGLGEGRAKATRGAASPYQAARQEAMRGYGERVAGSLGLSWWTLQHELTDLARDPLHRAAARLRALSGRGAPPERLRLYAAEVLDVLEAATLADNRPIEQLERAEQVVDGDEDVTQVAALLRPGAATRRDRVQFLDRYLAVARTLRARYAAEEG